MPGKKNSNDFSDYGRTRKWQLLRNLKEDSSTRCNRLRQQNVSTNTSTNELPATSQSTDGDVNNGRIEMMDVDHSINIQVDELGHQRTSFNNFEERIGNPGSINNENDEVDDDNESTSTMQSSDNDNEEYEENNEEEYHRNDEDIEYSVNIQVDELEQQRTNSNNSEERIGNPGSLNNQNDEESMINNDNDEPSGDNESTSATELLDNDEEEYHRSDEDNNSNSDHDETFGNDEEDITESQYDQPLYDEAPLTLAESLLSIFTFFITSNMSWLNFDKLLTLISLHLPSSSVFKKTRYLFLKYFNHGGIPMKKHWYCSQCMMWRANENTACQCDNNPERWYFIEMSIIDQLEKLLLKPRFAEDMNYKNTRQKQNPENIEDIYDGLQYREHVQTNDLHSNQYHVSFMWYSDGAPVFKSRKYSVWPLYLTINELPYKKRIQKENMIVAGIWFGPSDPLVNMFLKPLYDQMAILTGGVNMKIFGRETSIEVKSTLLCGTCDALARSDFLNHTRFNGYYGCLRCLSSGYHIHNTENSGNTHIYPYEDDPVLRTNEGHEEHVELAIEYQNPCYGVKGPSILGRLMPNIIHGTAVDIMHCVYSGVVKKLFELWLDSSYHMMPFSLRQVHNLIDKRIMNIKPPSFVKRMPRCLSKHVSYLKASELKNLFLYYSIPILYDIMETKYFEHYLQLVYGIYILNQTSISPESWEYSQKLLSAFVSKVQALYGPEFMSFNIHSLLHLPDVAKDLGPLWVTSCFPYEDSIGKMVNLVHGTRYVGMQIYSKLAYTWNVSNKLTNLSEGSHVRDYCKNLLTIGHRIKSTDSQIGDETYVIDRMSYLTRIPISLNDALRRIGFDNLNGINICVFKKIKRYGQVIHARNYTRRTKTMSNCIKIQQGNYENVGFVEEFVKICNCVGSCRENCITSSYYALCRKVEVQLPFSVSLKMNIQRPNINFSDERISIPYIYKIINEETDVNLINIECIITLCFLIENLNDRYVLEPSNKFEYDQ